MAENSRYWSNLVRLPLDLYYLYGVTPKVQGYAPEHALNGRQYEWIWLDT